MKRVFIANRGEIAIRIARSCKKLGYTTIGMSALGDETATHLDFCDEQALISAESPASPFLDQNIVVKLAKDFKADLLHPGYGFLSESPLLAKACSKNKIIFIGPNEKCLKLFGDKESAKIHSKKLNIPVLSTIKIPEKTTVHKIESLIKDNEYKYPLLIKALAGGGGRGMRLVSTAKELMPAIESASREALKFFGSGELILEPYLTKIKHIEVQVAVDSFGNKIHIFERECSAQRSYQKVIEEAGAANLKQEVLDQLYTYALNLFTETDYSGLATVEFLVTDKNQIYFTEVNPRLQVEHPVSEEISGIDLVEVQLKIAEGEKLSTIIPQKLKKCGHSIQVRIYAESSIDGSPRTGKINKFNAIKIKEPWIRIESAINEGSTVSHNFDPMVAKIIATGQNRIESIQRLKAYLDKLIITGTETNLPLLRKTLNTDQFIIGSYTTELIGTVQKKFNSLSSTKKLAAIALVLTTYCNHDTRLTLIPKNPPDRLITIGEDQILLTAINIENDSAIIKCKDSSDKDDVLMKISNISISTDSIKFNHMGQDYYFNIFNESAHKWNKDLFWIETDSCSFLAKFTYPKLKSHLTTSSKSSLDLTSSLPGIVLEIKVKAGSQVKDGDILLVIESMKMEHSISATHSGIVNKLNVKKGDSIASGQVLLTFS